MTTKIPLAVHEATVARHMLADVDDPILQGLHDAVKGTRENCAKAAATTETVLKNEMRTLASRHKAARDASFDLLSRSSRPLDDAIQSAQQEVATLQAKLKGPAPSRDPTILARQAELRERLAGLPEDRRKAIINEAIKGNDELLVGAILSGYFWESGFATEVEINVARHAWQKQNFAADLDRLERLSKAVEDATRAGTAAIAFTDGLTDSTLVSRAEVMERQATAALAAVK